MKYCLSSALFCIIFTAFSQDMALNSTPGIHEFVFVTEEASPLNLPEVRKEIGYPTSAIDAGIEGKVVCRVLVDESGEYKAHEVTYKSHPLLMEAVDAHMDKLHFKPAQKKGESVKFWVNVPIFFSLDEFGKRPSRDYEKLLTEGILFRDLGQYQTAASFFDRAIEVGMKKNEEKVSAFMLKAQLERTTNLYKLRKWEEARTCLTLGIGLAKDHSELRKFVPQLYLCRAWLALKVDHPVAAISDFNWLTRYHPEFHPALSSFEHSPFTAPGSIQELMAACSEMLVLQPHTPLAHWTRALCKQKLDDLEGAAADFEMLGKKNPTSELKEKAQNTAAFMFLEANQLGPALSILSETVVDGYQNPMGHYLKGIVLIRLTHYEDGCNSLKKAMELGLREQEFEHARHLVGRHE